MKKKAKHITVFVILFISAFLYLNKVFSSTHYYVNTSEDFKKLAKKTNLDIVFYGSSHAYTAFNPLIINDKCKTISYNLGSDGLKVQLTDAVLEESLKHTSPKLIILEVYSPTLTPIDTERSKGYHLRAMDFVSNYSLRKWRKMKRIYKPNEYLGVYFPLIRNHKKWNKQKYFDISRRRNINKKKNFYYGGFLGSRKIIDDEDLEKHRNFNRTTKKNDTTRTMISDQGKEDLIEFLKMAKKTGAEVLVVSAPDARARLFFNYAFFNQLGDICKSYDVSFLNLNDYYDRMLLTIQDFKDKSHLNTFGSIKASLFLSDYINSNYNLKDRSKEKIWTKEQKSYEIFKEEYAHTYLEID